MTPPTLRPRRTARAFALAFSCAIALFAPGCSREPAPAPGTEPSRAAQAARVAPAAICSDDRVDYLLASPVRTEPFLVDSTDTIAVLVSKLGYGQQDPLIQAKSELAQLGAAALPELLRFIEAQMNDLDGGARLSNAFGSLSLMDDPGAHDLLVRGLDHPQESVRIAAIKGLIRHPSPKDYDRLTALLPMSSPDTQKLIADALARSDAARAEDDLFTWMEKGAFPSTFQILLVHLVESRRTELMPRVRAAIERAAEEPAYWMRGMLAANGDPEAISYLRGIVREGPGPQRTLAVQVLHRAGLGSELAVVLESDPEAARRALAAQNLSGHVDDPAVRAAFQRGLADPVREVRKLCLGTLVSAGDANARDTAIAMLRGDKLELEDALLALRDAWRKDAALAQRGLDVLVGMRKGELQPLRVELRTIDRAIALVPLDAAAELLYQAAIEPGEPISGVSRHRWYAQMIGNTGAPGARLLRERWKHEEEAVRRLDLVSSAIYEQDDAARDFLFAVLDDPRTTPCEAMFVADKLCHFGPAHRVAPALKRFALRVNDPRVRPALNDLLWRWYGPHG
ncbi:MAG: hypothetical protein IPJ77_17820 [Planctomycetes bacterium]|nr:hypothetical protein [Planctomycetota bacterium]